ncbi:tetratricopeptide repeat protein [uncultured Psychrobacter sp.]|uniref:tetratricopeptide repeat protein n=1 Tax=uncultured Psychrobacter sp. TaxID=259303 RepID=UPI003458DBC9
MQLYLLAADNGSFNAQNNIGTMYYFGRGVTQSYTKAFEWYKKAADQGNQEASNRISRLVMDNKIDDEGIIIYSTEDTGLTLGDIE